MLSKACKSVIVIVCLFFLVNINVSAHIGIIDVNMGRYADGSSGIINIDLVDKNKSQLIVATLLDEKGNVIDAAKLNSSFSNSISWKVSSGAYKILLVNIKTGEKEVHYAIL